MVVMADLLRRGMRYDFVFIDGQHLYDYTMVDLFFADLLLKPGGMCCVDDITMDSVSTCVKYIASNYKHWTLLRVRQPCGCPRSCPCLWLTVCVCVCVCLPPLSFTAARARHAPRRWRRSTS